MRRNVIGIAVRTVGRVLARSLEVLSRDVFVIRQGRPRDERTQRDKRRESLDALAVVGVAMLILGSISVLLWRLAAEPEHERRERDAAVQMVQARSWSLLRSFEDEVTFPEALRLAVEDSETDFFHCTLCGLAFEANPSAGRYRELAASTILLYCPIIHEVEAGPRLLVCTSDEGVIWMSPEDAPLWLQDVMLEEGTPKP